MKNRRRSAVTQSLAGLVVALAVGCGSSNNNNNNNPGTDGGTDGGTGGGTDGGTGGGTLGSGNVTARAIANGPQFSLPFDSAPSPDGATVYFTGVDPTFGSAIFKVPAAGGTPTVVASGQNCSATSGCIGAPLGIAVSSDGATIYAADPAFGGASANDNGAIFSVAAAGGNPAALPETTDYAPRTVTVVKVNNVDNIFFIGQDKTTGESGIFKDVSGTVSKVISGTAANDPQAVTAYTDGTIYYLDANGSLQKIAPNGTTATAVGGQSKNIPVNFPAGIAVSQDGKFVLVPDGDAAAKGQGIARIDVSTGALTQLAVAPLVPNQEGGGIHRAANADIYSFVDTGAGPSGSIFGSGTVFLLK